MRSVLTVVLREKLGCSKVCARWLPYMLTEEQKRVGVNWHRQMLNRLDENNKNTGHSTVR